METEIERLNKMRERILEKSKKGKQKSPTKLKKEPKQDLGNDGIRPMLFTLYPEQVKELEEWKGHIKAIYGEYGDYKYIFETGGGIGIGVSVFSSLANITLDLTDYENF
jgi:hypothetical protein